MKITGIDFDSFLANTKKAFVAKSGSDVKGTHLIKQFLLQQFFPDAGKGENEHLLHSLFQADTPADEKPLNQVILVQLKTYEADYSCDTKNLCNVESVACANDGDSDAAVIKQQQELFLSNYPDWATGKKLLDGHCLIEEKLDVLFDYDNFESEAECEGQREACEEHISGLDDAQMANWLIENFDIDEICSDDFFCDYLNHGFKQITTQTVDVNY